MAKQRDPVIDSMRGIGIVLMVLGHSGFPGTDFIYLFHMALFFMLSGWLFSLRGGPVHFIKRKAVTLWLPFVLANTAFTVLNNLFLKLNILTSDERILQVPGNAVTTPVTVKDVIGRTVHWGSQPRSPLSLVLCWSIFSRATSRRFPPQSSESLPMRPRKPPL